MRVIVVGASGFFGSHLCATFLDHGHDVFAGVRIGSNLWRLDVLAPMAKKICLDLDDVEGCCKIFETVRPDVVINSAGYGVNYNEQDVERAFRVNVAGALVLANLAGQYSARMIQIGSSYEYGSSSHDYKESAPLIPVDTYGISKASASLLLLEAARNSLQNTVILRLFSMYGPLEGSHKIVPLAIRATQIGQEIHLTSGRQIRDYVYVKDATLAALLAANADPFPSGKAINVATGQGITLIDLLEAAVSEDRHLLKWGRKPYRPGELMRVVGDPSKALRLLGWEAKTNLTAGMAETMAMGTYRPRRDKCVS